MKFAALKEQECEWGRIMEKGTGIYNIGDRVGVLWSSRCHGGGLRKEVVERQEFSKRR